MLDDSSSFPEKRLATLNISGHKDLVTPRILFVVSPPLSKL